MEHVNSNPTICLPSKSIFCAAHIVSVIFKLRVPEINDGVFAKAVLFLFEFTSHFHLVSTVREKNGSKTEHVRV